MREFVFISALVLSTVAVVAGVERCGTDAFGNIVCLDKDGVLSTVPGTSTGGPSASGVSAADSKARRDEMDQRLRCGTDPFGNKVCR
ncbi:MAG: hypothetical protein U1C96_01430 [Gallionella sp.]|nr:hypothetical protein [Gallionella sp.]